MQLRSVIVGVATAVVAIVAAVVVVVIRREGGVDRGTIDESSIVVLGDSITEFGDWDRLLPDRPVANRGYAGFTTAELVPVAAEVADARPRAVVILTGTNDIRDGLEPDATTAGLETIIDRFQQASPETTIIVQTVLPRDDAPGDVAAVNAAIRTLAALREVDLLDLHPLFDDGVGGLRPAETTDGIHLSDAGYDRWGDALSAHLEELGIG